MCAGAADNRPLSACARRRKSGDGVGVEAPAARGEESVQVQVRDFLPPADHRVRAEMVRRRSGVAGHARACPRPGATPVAAAIGRLVALLQHKTAGGA